MLQVDLFYDSMILKHLSIPSRILHFIEAQSTALLCQYLKPLQTNFLNFVNLLLFYNTQFTW